MENTYNSAEVKEAEVIESTTEKQKEDSNQTLMDKIIMQIVAIVASFVRSSDRSELKRDLTAILSTISRINALGEYEIGLRVRGELYRFNEYKVTSALAKLVVPAKVVVKDVTTAYDFKKKDMFDVSTDPLTPAELQIALRRVCSKLRCNANTEAISRPPVGLLSEEIQYAVVGRKVSNSSNDHIVFLTQRFDDEAYVPLKEWINSIANKLFD